ncbi:MAG: RdgB/HAM1 family non-canonical purine NTP pyrophosphatase [Lachnospiraceae bacterium]|nr:RdgB/HAM1 family non-canonical purine NTP pyrophosphatase [Lachnospiraceae bacterium]
MVKRIIFATGNPGKVKEIEEILKDLGLEVVTMKEAGFDPEIEENGETLRENALIKVRAIGPQPEAIVMSDDSGLFIDALNGGPGIHSARFMGAGTPYPVKHKAVLDQMKGLTGEERAAHFACCVAMLFPDGRECVTEGFLYGRIAQEPAGNGGFGYDPIFWLPERGMTNAELPDGEKNRISHRFKALSKAKEILKEEI